MVIKLLAGATEAGRFQSQPTLGGQVVDWKVVNLPPKIAKERAELRDQQEMREKLKPLPLSLYPEK